MERLHRLLDRRLGVKAVDLQQVDVVRVEAAQRVLDLVEYGCPGQTPLILVVFGDFYLRNHVVRRDILFLADGIETLGQNHKLLTWDVVFLDRLADDLLRDTI